MRKFFAIITQKIPKINREQEIEFSSVNFENISPLLATPIINGLCQYKDIYELSLHDFYIMNEILAVKNENEIRLQNAIERKNRNK